MDANVNRLVNNDQESLIDIQIRHIEHRSKVLARQNSWREISDENFCPEDEPIVI